MSQKNAGLINIAAEARNRVDFATVYFSNKNDRSLKLFRVLILFVCSGKICHLGTKCLSFHHELFYMQNIQFIVTIKIKAGSE
jgi:hypothetical protein